MVSPVRDGAGSRCSCRSLLAGSPDANQEVDQAHVTIRATAGKLWVGNGAGPQNLAEGNIQVAKHETYRQDYSVTDGEGDFVLTSGDKKAFPFVILGPTRQLEWKISLNSDVPIKLSSQLTIGELRTNLSGLEIESFSMETIIGKSVVFLPENGDFEGDIKLVIGELIIYVLKDTPIQIETDTALTSVTYPDDYTKIENVILSPQAENAGELIKLAIEQSIGKVRIIYVK